MEQPVIVFEFDGGHGRVGLVTIETAVCFSCNQDRPCLVSDGSEDEYDAAPLCRDCINSLFETVAKCQICGTAYVP